MRREQGEGVAPPREGFPNFPSARRALGVDSSNGWVVSFGLELLLGDSDLSSDIPALGPPGMTSGEAGVALIPSIGWVHHREDSPISIGLGIYGIAGFRLNYPRDPRHPLLSGAIGLGPLFADADFLQIAPTVSYSLTDRLAIGIASTVTLGKLNLLPLGPPVTPGLVPGSGNRFHWGGGAQIGVYYIADTAWHLGATIKSPQWFEDFRSFTPSGVVKFDLDYPILSRLAGPIPVFKIRSSHWT